MSVLGDRALAGLRSLVAEPGSGDVVADRFEVREPIGEGASGVVFAAWDRIASREVALKIVRAKDEHAAARFLREAEGLAAVDHACVVRYLAHGVHEGAPWVAMERLVGNTLAERLRKGRLAVGDAIALVQSLAGALAAMHAAGLVHRDVKPSNVFLVEGSPRSPCLLDFGLARGREGIDLTAPGATLGTPGYMAPEQVRGDRALVGPPADVFALGCIAFECFTGRAAFQGDRTEVVLTQILLEAPPLVRAVRPAVSLPLEALVEQMLDKEAGLRPEATQIERELDALRDHAPDETSSALDAPTSGDEPGLTSGTVLGGKYRIERRLGEGGMGIVVAARHLELGKRVALKLLRRGQGADEARFLREAQAAARLESEHVARVLDVGRAEDGTPYMVMEYLSGVDFARRLREQGPLAIGDAVGSLLEAAEALAEAHALGIVHRDLKPSNLFLASRRDGTERLKVLDFGISKVMKPHAGASARSGDDTGLAALSMTGATEVVGSVLYMSPEQLHDTKNVDARTDVWALGVVLHELMSGCRPFEGESAAAIGARIAASPPKRLREHLASAPPELEAIVLRCLEKDPSKRYSDVAALATALAPFAHESARGSVERIERMLRPRSSPIRASTPAAASKHDLEPAKADSRRAPRPRSIALAIAIAAVLAVVALVFAARSRNDQPPEPAAVIATAEPPQPEAVTVAPPPANAAPSASPSASVSAAPALSVVAPPRRPTPRPPIAPTPTPSSSPSRPAAATTKRSELDLRDPALEQR